jgi:hypothetical protein
VNNNMPPFCIGDTVRLADNKLTDGTVVDIVDPASWYIRVYWRYPLCKVSDHYAPELVRVPEPDVASWFRTQS